MNATVPENAGVTKTGPIAGNGFQPPSCCTAITAERAPVLILPSIAA